MAIARFAVALALLSSRAAEALDVNDVPADPVSPYAIAIDDPRVALFRAALDAGFGTSIVAGLSPVLPQEVDRVLDEGRASLRDLPDGDGLLFLDPATRARGTRPAFLEGMPFDLTSPYALSLRGAHLLEGRSGVLRFSDADHVREGVQARGFAGIGASPHPDVAIDARARAAIDEDSVVLTWTRAAATLRAGGLRLTLGREPRWWGPGILNEVLLTNNALAGDGVEIATDGTQRLPLLGPIRASTIVEYFDDPGLPVPYPLLFGQRAAWRAAEWMELGAERTVMFGGAGRTERYTWRDIGNILLGRNENLRDYHGFKDTDQKCAFDATIYPGRALSWVPGLRGAHLFFRYAGDDGFEGLLPTRVAHHYGGSFTFARTSVVLELLENVAAGLWYWNDEYPRGYRNGRAYLGTDVGGDAKSGRLRITRAIGRDLGLRVDLFADSRGHLFHEGDALEPEHGAKRATATELGIACTRRLAAGRRVMLELRFRNPRGGYAYGDDRGHARQLVLLTWSGG